MAYRSRRRSSSGSRRSSGRRSYGRRSYGGSRRSGSMRRSYRSGGGRAQVVRLEIHQPVANTGAGLVPNFGPNGNITGFGVPAEPKTKSRF